MISVNVSTHVLLKWKGKFCRDSESSLCCRGHGDVLVMDGQCQDEEFHLGRK